MHNCSVLFYFFLDVAVAAAINSVATAATAVDTPNLLPSDVVVAAAASAAAVFVAFAVAAAVAVVVATAYV